MRPLVEFPIIKEIIESKPDRLSVLIDGIGLRKVNAEVGKTDNEQYVALLRSKGFKNDIVGYVFPINDDGSYSDCRVNKDRACRWAYWLDDYLLSFSPIVMDCIAFMPGYLTFIMNDYYAKKSSNS